MFHERVHYLKNTRGFLNESKIGVPGPSGVRSPSDLDPPGPFPKQAAAEAAGPRCRDLVGNSGQTSAHAEESRQGSLSE